MYFQGMHQGNLKSLYLTGDLAGKVLRLKRTGQEEVFQRDPRTPAVKKSKGT